VSEPRTDDSTLIAALRILARDIQSGDGCANACLLEAAMRLEELVDDRRWIPVGERLPEKEVRVFVHLEQATHKSHSSVIASRGSAGWLTDHGFYVHPTHWQPLPPGPEDE
jgi:hypothetical protein